MEPLTPDAPLGPEPAAPTAAPPTPSRPRRRWGRRLMWALASGAAIGTIGTWSLRWPAVQQSILRFADGKLREETGLSLAAQGFDFKPLEGRLVIRGLSLGGDLLQAARVEVRVRPFAFLGDEIRIRNLDIEGLRVVLDKERLSRIRLKPKKKPADPLKVRLDDLRIRGGSVEVKEPAWGFAEMHAAFDADGRGEGPNALAVALGTRALHLRVRGAGEPMQGSLSVASRISEKRLEFSKAQLNLGRQELHAEGSLGFSGRELSATLDGKLDLADLPLPQAGLLGRGAFQGKLAGTLAAPRWTLAFQGQGLKSAKLPLQPGRLDFESLGSLDEVQLRDLRWASADGLLDLRGGWRRGARASASFQARDLDLAWLGESLRIPGLMGLRAEAEGELSHPGVVWNSPALDAATLRTTARFQRGGASAGGLQAELKGGQFSVPQLQINLPDLLFEAEASGRLDRRGLSELRGKGSVATEAAAAAHTLRALKLVDLDMGGRLQAAASLSWTRGEGLVLDGGGGVVSPRWHGAMADRLKGTVQVRGNELYVLDITVDKGDGQGVGDLWLTWADLPPGSSQMDMCFRAHRLPVSEGMKAADLGELPLEGVVSGWARLGGAFGRLLLTGDVRVEDGLVYGLRLPAVASNLELDLTAEILRLPEFRIAESPALLYAGEEVPGGLLALRGSLDMALDRGTWTGRVKGRVDSERLGLPGPRFLGKLEASLEGPWTSPFGPIELPSGRLDLTGLRVFLGSQSLEGLRGSVDIRQGELEAQVGLEGVPSPFLKLTALHSGGRALGTVTGRLTPETAGTSLLARRLTDDVLDDLILEMDGSGVWGASGLGWEAFTKRFEGRFSAFTVSQERPGRLVGDADGATLDLALEARNHASGSGPAGKVGISGRLPFTFSAPVSLRAKGISQISEVKEVMDKLLDLDPYSLLSDMRPDGEARIDLTLGGSFGNPNLDGVLSLQKGRLSVKSYPQSVEELSFELQFQGRDILLKQDSPLRGRLAQGELRAWGGATWTPGNESVPGGLTAYNLEARLEDFQIRDLPEGFEMQGDLEATLRGDDENGGLLKGILHAERTLYRADINLADLLLSNTLGSTPDLSTLDPDDLLSRIELDLDLRLAQPWQFDTNLLKLQGHAEGPFRVRGTLAKPGLKGKMSLLPGGRLTNLLPAGDIVIEQGTLDFVDPAILDPVLNIQGRVDVPPYLVNLSLTGNLNQLSVSPTSTPSLRQDEIVSLLIDPATAQTVGTGATSQSTINSGLASASYGLISTLAFARFQENLRKTLGLDRVSFAIRTGTAGNLESNLILGKTFDILDRRIPLLYGYRKTGEAVTHSGQAEWRLGNLVMQLGLSRSGTDPVNPTGEIRYTWSPRW